MNKLLFCEYNMDTACVELKYADGMMIAIDTNAVEREFCDNMYQRSELDWLIYNKPKSEEAKQPQCPPDKEEAIRAALKHFGMI